MVQDHWLADFNYNAEDGSRATGTRRSGARPRSLAALSPLRFEDETGRFMIRSRTRVVKRHPEGIGQEALEGWRPGLTRRGPGLGAVKRILERERF